MRYFPPSKNVELQSNINNFHQLLEESLSKLWERFKGLLKRCSYHGMSGCIQIETYYNGLNEVTQLVIDALANGALLSKPYAEAFDILERISSNKQQWSKSRVGST